MFHVKHFCKNKILFLLIERIIVSRETNYNCKLKWIIKIVVNI